MKNFLLATFWLCLLAPLSAQSLYWVPQNSGTTLDLQDLHFHDQMNGWVVGDSGTVLHTTDGGLVWDDVSLPTFRNLFSIDFIDSDTGMILSEFAWAYLTYDGGATWTEIQPFHGSCYWDVIENDGAGNFILTYDGCFGDQSIYGYDPAAQDTFNEMYLLNEFPQFSLGDSIRDLGHAGPTVVMAVGENSMLLRSTDSGTNWSAVPAPDTSLDFHAVSFVDASVGYAVATEDFYPLFKTLDGGQSWSVDTTWDPTFFYPFWRAIDYHSSGNGILAGTTYGGPQQYDGLAFVNNYSPAAEVFPGQPLNAADMVADSLGWVVGDGGLISRFGSPTPTASAEPIPTTVTIFPNPTHESIAIRTTNTYPNAQTADLLDLHGRVLKSVNWTGNGTEISVGELPKGTYLLRISQNGRVETSRIVLE